MSHIKICDKSHCAVRHRIFICYASHIFFHDFFFVWAVSLRYVEILGTYVLYWSQRLPGQIFGVLVHGPKKKNPYCNSCHDGTKFWDQYKSTISILHLRRILVPVVVLNNNLRTNILFQQYFFWYANHVNCLPLHLYDSDCVSALKGRTCHIAMEDTITSPDGDTASCQIMVFLKNPNTSTNSVRFRRFLCASTKEVIRQRMRVYITGRTWDGFQMNHFSLFCIM